jgi:hypothetical protein
MAKVSSWYQFQASAFEIFGGMSGNETDFSPTLSVFPFHYNSTHLHEFKSTPKFFSPTIYNSWTQQ